MTSLVEILDNRANLITVKQLSVLLGSHPQTIYKWIRQRKLPFIRVGGRVKFDPVTIAKWLNERTIG